MSHIERGLFSLLKRKRYRFIAFSKIVLSDQGLAEHGGGGGQTNLNNETVYWWILGIMVNFLIYIPEKILI